MILFTRDVQYAVNAIGLIKGVPEITCARVSERTGMPQMYLARILHRLKCAGILESRRGSDGGYHTLPITMRTKTVIDLVNALGHDLKEVDGMRGSDRLVNAVYDALNITLEEFLR